jgi:hypothetical protein
MRATRGLAQGKSPERPRFEAFLTRRAAKAATQELDASAGSCSRLVYLRATALNTGGQAGSKGGWCPSNAKKTSYGR